MFREKFPHGVIETTEVHVDLDKGYARYLARVQDGEGGSATGYGTETAADFADFCERAETRALGRALAVLGFGTQFVGQDLTEGDHVADAPVRPTLSQTDAADDGTRKNTSPARTNGEHSRLSGDTGMTQIPSTNGHAMPPTPPTREPTDRPTEAHITALRTLAVVECREDPEVFAQRVRTLMRLKPGASVAPTLLTRTMTMAQYQEAMQYYERLQQQLTRPNVNQEGQSDGSTTSATLGSESAHPPTQEDVPTVPFVESSSASDPAEAPPAVDGPGQPAKPAVVYATREEIAALKKLAAQVGAEAAEDLADVLDHSRKGLLMDVYQRIEARLQSRLHGQTTAAVA
jgi:hypothetical protein